MKIEAGKYYRTRDGRKVGPMVFCGELFHQECGHRYGHWKPNGHFQTVGMEGFLSLATYSHRDLIAEWTDEPKTWGEMTDAEKVKSLAEALNSKSMFDISMEERAEQALADVGAIKTEPTVETVMLTGKGNSYWVFSSRDVFDTDTHRITFNTIDGEPDCGSIKMKKLNKDT